MTQYKLIKSYPGHALGEIHTADKSTKWYGTNFYNAYPEFWKKVEEVDFDKPILSLNDILNAWETNEYLQNIDDYKQSPLFNNFKKAAENKLNPKSKGILAQEYINNIETFYTEVKYSLKK